MTTIGITGHRDIPSEALSFVQRGVADVIRRFSDQPIGVSSLADGADQLFAKALLRSGGRLHAVIPCRGYEGTFSDQASLDCFLDLVQKADIVEVLDHPEPSEDAFLDAGHRVVDLSNLLIAIWDGKVAKGKGGTADIVRYARERGCEVVVLWPAGVTR